MSQKYCRMCDYMTMVFLSLLGVVLFCSNVFGLQLVPARRITCNPYQSGVGKLFAITLKAKDPSQKGGDTIDVVEAHESKEPIILSPPQAPLGRPFLTKSSGGGLFIDVFFPECPCSSTTSHHHSSCSDPSPGALNFTCHYIYTDKDLVKNANVSEINMTSMACCDPGLCRSRNSEAGSGIQEVGAVESLHVKGDEARLDTKGGGGGEDPTRTILFVVVAVLGLLVLMLVCACIYLWKKTQRLQRAQMGIPPLPEDIPLQENALNRI